MIDLSRVKQLEEEEAARRADDAEKARKAAEAQHASHMEWLENAGFSRAMKQVDEAVTNAVKAARNCGATTSGSRYGTWAIDHDHVTKKVRGLLCQGCNIALGYMEEDEDRILGLIEYLRMYKENSCSDVQPLPSSV